MLVYDNKASKKRLDVAKWEFGEACLRAGTVRHLWTFGFYLISQWSVV